MRLALGTVQFGLPYGVANKSGQVSQSEAKSMIRIASENGIDTLDTAIAYGESEKCLGFVGVKNFKLVTKLPSIPDGCLDISGWIYEQVTSSLLRLNVEKLYGLLLHKSEDLLGPDGPELYRSLDSLKEKGLVKKIGVSIYSPNELDALIPLYRFDLVQSPFNIVDRRLYTTGWLRRLKDADVEIHTRSALLQGLLLMKQADIPQKFSPWDSLWQTWHKWLAEKEVSALQTCLAFPLSFPEIDQVVVGIDNQSQLAQIVSAAKRQPTGDLPNLLCEDENLINPANWNRL